MGEHVRIAIVGSGFAGLGAAIMLAREGIDDFVVLERTDDVGGTWRDNTYPGCACDVESHLYSFSFAPNPGWSRRFSPQPEIRAYLRRTAERHGVLPRIRFSTEFTGARWNREELRWRIETTRGPLSADVLISAAGPLSVPAVPDLPGLETFTGTVFHSARWRHDHELAGRRVAVIGTGASAIQFVPQIAPTVEALDVYQRTAPWILPRRDRAISGRAHRLYRRVPGLQRLARAGLYLLRESFLPSFRMPRITRLAQRLALRHLAAQVPDPALRTRLTPDYAMGCKRVLLSDDYLPALTRENVSVVTDGIREVDGDAIVTADGARRRADTIILATGFHVTDNPIAEKIRGRDSRSLAEIWRGSPQAYLGTTVAGFPNLFLLLGPNTGLGHNSTIIMIEAQLGYVSRALRHLRRTGSAALEPRPVAQASWVSTVDTRSRGTVWTTGGCASWYLDRTGRNSTLWPRSSWAYRRRLARFRAGDHVLHAVTNHDAAPPPTAATRRLPVALSSHARTVSAELERVFLRAMLALPPGALARITRPPRGADSPMDPHVQLVLALRRLRRYPGLTKATPEATRDFMRRQALLARATATTVGAVRECTVDGHAGPRPARHYIPPEPADGAPLLLYFHGGGFVSGDLDVLDEACRMLCRHSGAHVLSVSYRLAPEHPFPAALKDTLAAYRWTRSEASALGVDPNRIAVGGDSSGANLATVICHLLADADEPMPAAQLLLYPPTHYAGDWLSRSAYVDGFLLTADDISFFYHHYRAGFDPDDFRHSPLRGTALDRLPPALVITAALDPMRDEGEAYADAMRRAGVHVDHWRVPGMPHAFINLTTLSPAAHDATVEIGRRLARLLGERRVTAT